MFRLTKKVFITLLSCIGSLATKCVYLNNEPCMARCTVIDLNHIEPNYYQFMIIQDKCSGYVFPVKPKM